MNEILIRMLYHINGGDTIKIGFIGPGKVGVNLGRYFTQKGITISGFYGQNINSTKEAINITKSKFYENIKDIIKESDILFITTPDDIISIIDTQLSKFNLNNKSICHTSGSLKSNVLYNSKNSGALIYSIHPMFAFSNKNINLNELEKIYFSIEGDYFKNSPIEKLIKKLGNKYFLRKEEDSATYHLANVFVSNLILSLLNIGISYFKKLGLSENDSLEAIKPLVKGNIESIFEKGFVDSLTGPVLRGDLTTIEKHLNALDKDHKELYKILSLNLLKLVALRENADIINLQKENNLNSKKDNNLNSMNEDLIEILLSNSKKHSKIFGILGGTDWWKTQ